jgi:hypothetical protein
MSGAQNIINMNTEISKYRREIREYVEELKRMKERSEQMVKYIHENNGKIQVLQQIKEKGVDKILVQGDQTPTPETHTPIVGENLSEEPVHPHHDHEHHHHEKHGDCNCPPGEDCNCNEDAGDIKWDESGDAPIVPLKDLYSQFTAM